MRRALLFGGAAEGHEIAAFLLGLGCRVTVSVAGEYAAALIGPAEGLTVAVGRLDAEKMAELMRAGGFDIVIDATHPYAVEVTSNIKAAAGEAGVKYLRFLRESSETAGCICCGSIDEAVELLAETEGAVLIATGSKQLEKYALLPDFAKRCYARVLPTEEALQKCAALGLGGERVIAMRGPFSQRQNAELLKGLDIKVMVTKDGGEKGGFPQKAAAAAECGVKLIVISRPDETGLSMDELQEAVKRHYGI